MFKIIFHYQYQQLYDLKAIDSMFDVNWNKIERAIEHSKFKVP